MVYPRRRRSHKEGHTPGSLVHVGHLRFKKPIIDVLDYTASKMTGRRVSKIEDTKQYISKGTSTWVHILGIHDTTLLESLGNLYKFHPLTMEDVCNSEQRPKFEAYDSYFFVALKMVDFDPKNLKLEMQQINILVGKNYVVSLQERDSDLFEALRDRVKNAKGRIRTMGNDYLAYALIDRIADRYFTVLESIGDCIEKLEEQLLTNPDAKLVRDIHRLKRTLIIIRKSVWPVREIVNSLHRQDTKLIKDKTLPYLKDLYDHTIQIIDTVETYRDMVSGMLDVYLSCQSNKMNEVMKVLTVIATIFIPLTFITGVYGMNFEYMPELGHKYGYFFIWGVMFSIFIALLVYFRRKKWI